MLEVEADVPIDLILKGYKMGGRLDPDYFCSDLLSDILGSGRSARLYNALVKEQAIFSEIDAYISGDVDPGLFLIEGKLQKGISFEQAENAIQTELNKLIVNNISADELTKVINKTETNILFGDVNILNRAMKLAFAKFMGDLELVNTEIISYQSVTVDQIRTTATNMFREENCSTIYYKSKTNA
jgi:predicted Zn-dependent peptidase